MTVNLQTHFFFMIVLWSCLVTDSYKSFNCSPQTFEHCRRQLDENKQLACDHVLRELPRCIYAAQQCPETASKDVTMYGLLRGKLQSYKYCFKTLPDDVCNETLIELCHSQFLRGKKPLCDEMKIFRGCVGRSSGCHVMRNPWYALSVSMIMMRTECFIKNYSSILQVLNGKGQATSTDDPHGTHPTPITAVTCIGSQPRAEDDQASPYLYMFVIGFAILLVIIITALVIIIYDKQRKLKYTQPPLFPIGECRMESEESRQGRAHCMLTQQETDCQAASFGVEPPPPYFSQVMLLHPDQPPPYTSRPSSVNGEFV